MKLSGNLVMSHWKTGLRMLSNNIYPCLSGRSNHWKFYKVKIVVCRRKLIFLFSRVSKDLSIRASNVNPQRSQFSLYSCLKVRKTAKIRKRYNQVPHLTQGTTWESNKNTINIHKHENHVGVDKVTLMFLF